jgi:Protein of unknown function (DUF2934)
MKPDKEPQNHNLNPGPPPLPLHKINHFPANSNARLYYKPSRSKTLKQQLDQTPRESWISDAAYYKAEARGFLPGFETDDWREAEHDYVEMLVGMFLSVFKEDSSMTITGLRQLAKAIGIPNVEKIDSKLELIRLIQVASNHTPCFRAKPGEYCQEQSNCQWQTECRKLVAEWWR